MWPRRDPEVHRGRGQLYGEPEVRCGPDPQHQLPPGLAADAEAFFIKDDLPPGHPLYGKQGHFGLNRRPERVVGRRGV